MQTERVTFLTSPETKAALTAKASERGISVGEYVRRKVEDDDDLTPAEEAELAALVKEVNLAVPKMNAMFDEMQATIRKSHDEVDRLLREMGARE
jgi:hypothetical protein